MTALITLLSHTLPLWWHTFPQLCAALSSCNYYSKLRIWIPRQSRSHRESTMHFSPDNNSVLPCSLCAFIPIPSPPVFARFPHYRVHFWIFFFWVYYCWFLLLPSWFWFPCIVLSALCSIPACFGPLVCFLIWIVNKWHVFQFFCLHVITIALINAKFTVPGFFLKHSQYTYSKIWTSA